MSAQEGIQQAEQRYAINWRRLKSNAPLVGLAAALVLLLGGLALNQLSVPLQILILAIFSASVVALRYDVVTCAVAIAVAILFDYYQLIAMPKGFPWVGLLIIVALLTLIFIGRSPERPWVALYDLRWWALLLVLVALAIPRSVNFMDGVIYFINVIVVGLCAWAVAILVITNPQRLRQLIHLLSVIAVLVSLQSIIYSRTHIFILETPSHYAWLKLYHFFEMHGSGHVWRAGSYLLNPDTNGAYLGVSLFLPLGLLASATTWRWRLIHGAEAALILIALLFTYTAAAFVGVAGALIVFLALAFRPRQVLFALGGLFGCAAVALLVFPSELQRLLEHATGPSELTTRSAIWETALNIIRANPLLGIGLGIGPDYNARSAPYMSPVLKHFYSHPHNSFLELAAMAGIPVLIVFVVILARAIIRAARNYQQADWATRPVIAGVLAAVTVLTIHAFADSTWTIPVLVPIGWMLVGAISSPKLRESLAYESLTHGTTNTTLATPVRYHAGNPEAVTPGAESSSPEDGTSSPMHP